MDNAYHLNGMSNHSQLGSMQQRMSSHNDGHTLPPLNEGPLPPFPTAYSTPMSQHPITTTASYPPVSQSHHSSSLPQLHPQRPTSHMNAYSQPGSYAMSQPMMPPSSTMMAPTLSASNGGRALPDIHPRPSEGSFLSQLQSAPNMLAPTPASNEPEPIHVVGQQGRRGILPSAPGRAPANVKTAIPQKDASGKWPCPNCAKTYQHAKHLKRHLLRHTGDRPYMCKLCKDTFSRSDILKRHFQKCSVRRGVPPEMDHLEGSRAHLQKNRQPIDSSQNLHFMNAVHPSPVYDGGAVSAAGQLPSVVQQQQQHHHHHHQYHPSSARNSRSNSVVQPANSFLEGRRSMSAAENLQTSGGAYGAYSAPTGIPGVLSNGLQSANASTTHSPVHNLPNGMPNGHGYNGYGGPEATQGMLNEGQHNYHHQPDQGGPTPSPFPKADVESAQSGQTLPNALWSSNGYQAQGPCGTLDWITRPSIKTEAGDEISSAYLTGAVGDGNALGEVSTDPAGVRARLDFVAWDTTDPMEQKLAKLVEFCTTHASTHDRAMDSQNEATLRAILTFDNVKLFLEEYKNFQGHWPLLHMPTFNPAHANDALLLAIISIGAVYSDKLSLQQSRWLMDIVKSAVHSSPSMIAAVTNSDPNGLPSTADDIEHSLAVLLLQCIFVWHGSQAQRARAREEWPMVVAGARSRGLLHNTPSSNPVKSILHRLDSEPPLADSSWDWSSWIEQEKRNRAFWVLYLMDCALAIYFNCTPQFDLAEIHLRLPADDAAWEAGSSDQCARMLGFFGPDAQEVNISGSLAPRQPDLHSALRNLFDHSAPPVVRETNAFGKFILIHALHVMLWTAQRASSPHGAFASLHGVGSGASTPDLRPDSSATASATNSSSSPPTLAKDAPMAQFSKPSLRNIRAAIDKWKHCWDTDNDIQYRERLPRLGFCRDGVYFLYLATYFYNRANRAHSSGLGPVPNDTQLPADTRFTYVMDLLKRIKQWIKNEQGKTGKDFELSGVGSIDAKYGVEDLTLDMKLLFTRILSPSSTPSIKYEHQVE